MTEQEVWIAALLAAIAGGDTGTHIDYNVDLYIWAPVKTADKAVEAYREYMEGGK